MTIIYIASIVALLLVMLLLSVKIIFKKGGQFPSSHVGAQKPLRDKGISCHTSQHSDTIGHRNLKERLAIRED